MADLTATQEQSGGPALVTSRLYREPVVAGILILKATSVKGNGAVAMRITKPLVALATNGIAMYRLEKNI